MEGAAIHGRLAWRGAKVVTRRRETDSASTLVLEVPGWPGHDAGQHVDVRLTADDGYSAVRTYSIASAPDGEKVELTIELMPDGEVSPYLVQSIKPGDPLEILGPIGGWFVWRPEQTEPVQLVAGGSGVVPLMCMIRTRELHNVSIPFHLIYSVRGPESAYYWDELQRLASINHGVTAAFAYTRTVPPNWPRKPGRIDGGLIAADSIPATQQPTCYVCGPTGFVESVAGLLTAAGHDPSRIRTERFGPT